MGDQVRFRKTNAKADNAQVRNATLFPQSEVIVLYGQLAHLEAA